MPAPDVQFDPSSAQFGASRSQKRIEDDRLLAEANAINTQMGDLEQRLAAVQERLQKFLEVIPNLPHESVPAGKSAEDNAEQRRWSPGGAASSRAARRSAARARSTR
jgi:seryl-tRNA synthetase